MAGLTHRAVNIELASRAASPKKTDPAPAAPAIAPAEAGTTNWPTRLAVNLAEIAKARSSGGAILETSDMVKGWFRYRDFRKFLKFLEFDGPQPSRLLLKIQRYGSNFVVKILGSASPYLRKLHLENVQKVYSRLQAMQHLDKRL